MREAPLLQQQSPSQVPPLKPFSSLACALASVSQPVLSEVLLASGSQLLAEMRHSHRAFSPPTRAQDILLELQTQKVSETAT
jgi:hypothetical protein